jgi:hypothetical protein
MITTITITTTTTATPPTIAAELLDDDFDDFEPDELGVVPADFDGAGDEDDATNGFVVCAGADACNAFNGSTIPYPNCELRPD